MPTYKRPSTIVQTLRNCKTRKQMEAVWKPCKQWRADVWWCPGRLLDWIPPTKF